MMQQHSRDQQPSLSTLPAARLEDWLRERYFESEVDLSSSGMRSYSFRELCEKTELDLDVLLDLEFRDSHTYGGPGLREAIALRWPTTSDGVMVTNGSNEALFLVLAALVSSGSKVVVPAPGYHMLTQLAATLGASVRAFSHRAEDGFRPRVDELVELIRRGCDLVVVNYPHNPTGTTVTRAEMDAIIEAGASVGAYILWDGAFSEMMHAREDTLPLATGMYERACHVGTLSKAYGLSGLRVGWAAGPQEVLSAAARVRDYVSLHPSPVIEYIATAAVDCADALLAPRLHEAQQNLKTLADWVGQRPHIVWTPPIGGVASVIDLGLKCEEPFAEDLLKQGVLLVPAQCFGDIRGFRIGVSAEPTAFAQALARIDFAVERARQERPWEGTSAGETVA